MIIKYTKNKYNEAIDCQNITTETGVIMIDLENQVIIIPDEMVTGLYFMLKHNLSNITPVRKAGNSEL